MKAYHMTCKYQENGRMAMTIVLTAVEVTNAGAKKRRGPVTSVAADGAADSGELVDFDTFNMMDL